MSHQSNARVSLTKSQLQEGIGAELFSLCQGMTADGKISKAEIVALGEWLNDHQTAPLPGIALLTETLKRIIADGKVTRDEQRELMEAIEKVLPADARKGAKSARREVEKKRKADEKAAERTARDHETKQVLERLRLQEPEDDFDFMVAGVHAEGRHSIVSRYLSVGDRVRLMPEPNNPHDDCAVAVTLNDGRIIGYVPRDDSDDIAGCIDDCGYYVASVKKILTGGRLPIPVIVVAFYRADQLSHIGDLQPTPCLRSSVAYRPTVRPQAESGSPWWKLW
jgi:hypothetical protein